MNAIITSYKKKANGIDTEYDENRKPIKIETIIPFPLKFGYGSYNEPKILFDSQGIQVDDIISINIQP
jgi:hypothetical protein